MFAYAFKVTVYLPQTKNVEKRLIVEFFTTSKCERPNHILDVTCESEFCFSVFLCVPSFRGPKSKKKTCLRFAIFNFSENLQNIYDIG